MSNLNTPYRDITPPNEKPLYKTCYNCLGEGKVLIEIESEDPNEDFDYNTETCNVCKGDGVLLIDVK